MGDKFLNHTGLEYLWSKLKTLLDNKSNKGHTHTADSLSGTVPVSKGGTGATTAAGALSNLGVTATATELNYVDGVTGSIQTQLDGKSDSEHTHNYAGSSSAGGSATSAVKLTTARTIDGVSFNGSANIHHFGTCSTAAGTAAKTVSLSGFTLATGAKVAVKFTVTNTASNPTLNVNSTGAKSIMYRGSAISAGYLAANRVYEFVYDGTDYELIGDINTDTNTTYSAATTSKDGLMSAAMVEKLSGITESADSVSFTANATSGNKVGTITINGSAVDMYSPTQTTVSGNAGTATKLATARTIRTNLGSTETASFDGTGNVTPGVTGTLPIANGGTGATTAAGALTNLGLTATAAELNYMDGVKSNVQTQLDGKAASSHGTHVTYSTTAPKANGTASAGSASTVARSDHVHPLQTTVSGNAGTATKLAAARTIALSGGATGTATSFDGSADITIPVTKLDATKLSGTIPIGCIPKGALERLVITSTDTTRLALTSSDVQAGDVVKVESTGLMYYVADESALGTEDAFEPFTAGTASAVAWGNVTGKPSFATVATSGKYSDLSGTPTIPSASSTTPKANGTAAVGTGTTWARADHVHPLQTTVSGNAGSATKLATARTIDGVSFDGSAAIVHYGTCSTAAATAAKTVSITGFTLVTGARALVKFTITNTASSPTLNVNSTGAKAIYYKGAAITAGYLKANYVYEFVYNGTQYDLVGDVDTNSDTKVTQTVTTTDAEYPLLASTTAGATATATTTTRFASGVTMNPADKSLTATTFNGALSGNASTATKLATARTIRTNLGSTSTASFDGSENVTPGVTGTLPIANGGTGLTASPSMLVNLASTTADTVLEASPRPGVTGTLPLANGGTGATTAANARTNLGAEASANKTTTVSSSSTDTQYPSAKAVYTAIQDSVTIPVVENTDSSNKTPLRTLASGTYILRGYFTAYSGSSASFTFSNDTLVFVVYSSSKTYVQIPYAKANVVQYLEITDTGYTRNDAKLPNMESTSNKVTDISSGVTDDQYPSAKAVYNAIENSGHVKTSGDTMEGILVAHNNTDYTTKQVRNIFLIADGEDLPDGANGEVCLVYTP